MAESFPHLGDVGLMIERVGGRGSPESGEIQPSAPTKRLLKLAMERPELFKLPEDRRIEASSSVTDSAFVHEALRAAHIERLYEPLFAEPANIG